MQPAFSNVTAVQARPLSQEFIQVRTDSEALCTPLEIEDYGIQTMPDVSPPKWHLAHTSWFFETFLLRPFFKRYQEFDENYARLFNSYYEQVGTYHTRAERGLLSRPTIKQIYAYRQHVNAAMLALLEQETQPNYSEIVRRSCIGLHHEQQHQELLLTDIKHIFAYNPLRPVYRELPINNVNHALSLSWHEQVGGVYEVGTNPGGHFAYDNEMPRHKIYLNPFRLASRLVTNGEYLEFINAGGYQNPVYWLSDGWKTVQTQHWQAPLYWIKRDTQWHEMTLGGLRKLDEHAPVSHVSLYEAHAYANWCNKRLPYEAEWEIVARQQTIAGNLRDSGYLQPMVAVSHGLTQFYGDVWEWTRSSYSPYPGYRADAGALGEYNGKFMSNQVVLRGGSCVTPKNHIRATYRNFFYPGDRWQFSGIRLAEDIT